MDTDFRIVADKDIRPGEFALLMEAVGYGRAGHYAADVIERSLAAYPFVAHARDARDELVGYVSAFSDDDAFSTFIGELVVDPHVQRRGVGTRLLEAVEARFAGVPVFIHPFVDVQAFYLARGYRGPRDRWPCCPGSIQRDKARFASVSTPPRERRCTTAIRRHLP
jgi:GNAT superfamily N-acetyltransferase